MKIHVYVFFYTHECTDTRVYTEPGKSFSSVHLQISPLMLKPYPLPVFQEHLDRPVTNHEEVLRVPFCTAEVLISQCVSWQLLFLYCSTKTRCQHSTVECAKVQQKGTLSHQLAWPSVNGKSKRSQGFLAWKRWSLGCPFSLGAVSHWETSCTLFQLARHFLMALLSRHHSPDSPKTQSTGRR